MTMFWQNNGRFQTNTFWNNSKFATEFGSLSNTMVHRFKNMIGYWAPAHSWSNSVAAAYSKRVKKYARRFLKTGFPWENLANFEFGPNSKFANSKFARKTCCPDHSGAPRPLSSSLPARGTLRRGPGVVGCSCTDVQILKCRNVQNNRLREQKLSIWFQDWSSSPGLWVRPCPGTSATFF